MSCASAVPRNLEENPNENPNAQALEVRDEKPEALGIVDYDAQALHARRQWAYACARNSNVQAHCTRRECQGARKFQLSMRSSAGTASKRNANA